MKNITNPFELMTYLGPEYFCDREDELIFLNESLQNRRNTIISSARRLGKTNLIAHWHHSLKSNTNIKTLYFDILHTKSDKEFLNYFATSALNLLQRDKNLLSKFIEKLSSFRPVITLNPMTNQPEVSFDYVASSNLEMGINALFELLKNEFQTIQITIDEFQTISTYEEGTKVDAILRKCMTQFNGFHFVYSGSQEHILSTIFSDPQKPMFGSTQHFTLNKIGYRPYFEFIKYQFEKYKKEITDEAVHEILTWTRQHTFYTHFLANEVFSNTKNIANLDLVYRAEKKSLQLFEVNFITLLKNLSNTQQKVLKAVAKEGVVENIFNKNFLSKYKLAASSVSQSLEALEERELVKKDYSTSEPVYFLQDVFLSNYLNLH